MKNVKDPRAEPVAQSDLAAEAIADNLLNQRTAFGLEVVRQQTSSENYARSVVSKLQHDLVLFAFDWLLDGSPEGLPRVGRAVTMLRAELPKARHLGDNKPGLFSSAGVPLLPDPRFTYWNLFEVGFLAPESGRQALAPDFEVGDLLCGCGILDCHEAIEALDTGEPFLSTFYVGAAYQSFDLLQRLVATGGQHSTSPEEARQVLSKSGRAGGHASGEARRAQQQAKQTQAIRLYEECRRDRKHVAEDEIPGIVASKMKLGLSTVRGYLAEHRKGKR